MSSTHTVVAPRKRGNIVAPAAFAAVAFLTAAAVVLRLHALGAKSFWMDEGITAAYMRLDWYNLARLLWRREANMTLYYLLQRTWVHFGDSVAWYRGLSAVFSVATVPAMYALGKRLFGTMAGVTAALLLTVNAYHVRYAQDARSYSLVVFLITLATYFLVRAVETGNRADWKWYVALSVLSVYAHFFAILVVAAQWASLRVLPAQAGGGEAPHVAFLAAAKRIGLWTLPVWIFIGTTGAGTLRWMHRPGVHDLYEFFEQYAGNGGWRLLGLYLACVALAIVATVRIWRRHGRSIESWRYALVLSWFAVPVLISLTVTLALPVFLPRYLQVCLPAFILLAVAGLASVKYKWAAVPALALIVWFALGGVRSYYEKDFDIPRQDYRGVAAYVLEHSRPGDVILFNPGQGRCAYQYYADHYAAPSTKPTIVFPGHGDRMLWRDFMGSIPQRMLDSINLDKSRVWVVVSTPGPQGEDPVTQRIKTTLGQRRLLAESRDFTGLNLYLYEP